MYSGFSYFDENQVNLTRGTASNVVFSENPTYTKSDFYAYYPAFTDLLPDAVIDDMVVMANNAIIEQRWKAFWKAGMANYIAHFATLYLQATEGVTDAQTLLSSAQTRGLISSKSVGDVSVSYGYAETIGNTESWTGWASTSYGLNLINLAKQVGKGGMYVW